MNKTFSAHMLKTFVECPKKYKLMYENGLSIPQNKKAAEEGKKIHALINYSLQGFNTTKLSETLSQNENEMWKNFVELDIKKSDLFASEYGFNVKLDTYWLNGRIDAIIKKEDNYTIYDWKTGKSPKNFEKDLQTAVYLTSFYEILRYKKLIIAPQQLSFIYYNLSNNSFDKIIFSDELKGEYYSLITGIITNIEDNNYLKKEIAKTCQKCNFEILCR